MTVTVYALLSKTELNDALSIMTHDAGPTQVYLSCPNLFGQDGQQIALEYQLPSGMPAALLDENGALQKDTLSTVVDRVKKSEKDSNIFVPCLPTILATKAVFPSEQAKREQESTVKRLIRGDRSWIHFDVADPSTTKFIAPIEANIEIAFPQSASTRSLERVAAAVATAIFHGKSELSGKVICQIDTGSAALISQILGISEAVPKQEEAFEIRNRLIRQMLGAAADRKIVKSKRWTARKADLASTTLFMSSLLPKYRFDPQETSNEPERLDWSQLAKDPDEFAYTYVMDMLLSGSVDPRQLTELTVNYVQEVLKQTLRRLEQEQTAPELFRDTSSPFGRVTSGLGRIIKNAAHSTDDLFAFLANHANETGLSAIAIVMWGWSDRFGDTVEKRLSSADYPKIRQLAMTLVAAAGGYCELPLAYPKRPTWLSIYKQSWMYLISPSFGGFAEGQALSLDEPVDKTSSGETRLEFPLSEGYEISIALVIRDPRLAAIRKLANYLNGSGAQLTAACSAITALYRRHEELFPAKARNHIVVNAAFTSRTIHWDPKRRRQIIEGVPVDDFEQSFDVSNARLFADQLSPRWIDKFINSLNDVELKRLNETLSSA